VDQFRSAIGIAGSFASGLFEFVNDGSLVKRLHPGNAAKSGILAAMLARQGFSGPRRVLEGSLGFFNAFADGCTPGVLLRDLGRVFEVARTSYKQYACCSYCHPLMDALLAAIDCQDVEPEEVSEIVGRTFSAAIHVVAEPLSAKQNVLSPVDAQFSAPYCLAVVLVDRRAMPDQFSAQRIQDPVLRDLTRRIRVESCPAFDATFPQDYPAEVELRKRDGSTLRAAVRTSKGDPSWPLTQQEIEQKFLVLAGGALGERRAEDLRDAVMNLDQMPDLRDLWALMTPT
jgi:2-methylcitrate dehydratase PrpD